MLAKPTFISALAAIAVLSYLASTAIYQNRKAKWAREVALPQIQDLLLRISIPPHFVSLWMPKSTSPRILSCLTSSLIFRDYSP